MNKADHKERAEKWAGTIRAGCEEAISDELPDLNRYSMFGIEVQMLLRTCLILEAEEAIRTAEDADEEDWAAILQELRPQLIEELIPPATPMEEQMVLMQYLLRCLESGESFDTLFTEIAPDWLKISMQCCLDTAHALRKKALEYVQTSAERYRRCRENFRIGTFPADYPYMDEFEYIDHCIAGDDD